MEHGAAVGNAEAGRQTAKSSGGGHRNLSDFPCHDEELIAKKRPDGGQGEVEADKGERGRFFSRHGVGQKCGQLAVEMKSPVFLGLTEGGFGQRDVVVPEIPVRTRGKLDIVGPMAISRPPRRRALCTWSSVLPKAALSGKCSKKLLVNTTSRLASSTGHGWEQSCRMHSTSPDE